MPEPFSNAPVSAEQLDFSAEFADAYNLMERTSDCLFITGSAGTGKSTLLNYFREHTAKNVVVLAPTGIAALNVGGQTIHSFFQISAWHCLRRKALRAQSIKNYTKPSIRLSLMKSQWCVPM
jgi:predicted ATPase